MRSFLSLLASPVVAALLVGCAGDNFAPGGPAGAAGSAGGGGIGVAGSGAGGKGGASGGGNTSAGQGGADVASGAGGGGNGGEAAGAAGEGGSTDGGAGGTSGGVGGTTAGGSGAAGSPVGGAAGAAGNGVAGSSGGGAAGNGGAGGGVVVPCDTLFVRPDGSDENAGCVSSMPLRHLGVALDRAAASAGKVSQIRLCAGSFQENALTVSTPVNISGSWNCDKPKDWTLNTEIDQANATTEIVSHQAIGLTFAGPSHTPALSSLTRVVLAMTPVGSAKATGILLSQGASPTLQFSRVYFPNAPTAKGDNWGSAALIVEGGSNARVLQNIFSAGPGQASATDAVGSVGVGMLAPGAGFELRGNQIRGGRGTPQDASQHGSAGIVLAVGDNNVAIHDNPLIDGGTGESGSTGNFEPLASVGVLIRRSPTAVKPSVVVSIERSSITGGKAATCGSGCRTRGIFLQRLSSTPLNSDVDLSLVEARVYGGDHAAITTGLQTSAYTDALRVERNKVVATSSVFHGGGLDLATPYPRAIALAGGRFEGHFVTILPGKLQVSTPTASPFSTNGVAFWLQAPTPKVELEDSLIVASDRQTYGIYGEGEVCTDGYGLNAKRVRFVQTEAAVANPHFDQVGFFAGQSAGCPAALVFQSTPFPVNAKYPMDLLDVGHVYGVAGSGTVEQLAITGCASSSSCLGVVYPDLDDPNAMRAAVLEPNNGKLAPACKVGAGLDNGATVSATRDLLGRARNGGMRRMLGAVVRPNCLP